MRLLLLVLPLIGCATAVKQADIGTMPPLVLCQSYERYSRLYTTAEGRGEQYKNDMLKSASLIHAEIQKQGLNCKDIMLPKPNQTTNKMVNCFPNQATGGITCL